MQGTQNSQNNLEKEQSWRTHFLMSKLTTELQVIKKMWHWQKGRHINEWDRMENPQINPPTYSQLIFDESHKTI